MLVAPENIDTTPAKKQKTDEKENAGASSPSIVKARITPFAAYAGMYEAKHAGSNERTSTSNILSGSDKGKKHYQQDTSIVIEDLRAVYAGLPPVR